MAVENPFIRTDIIRFRYVERPTEWKSAEVRHKYQDNTESVLETADTAPKKWELVYNFDLEDAARAAHLQIFDDFFEEMRYSRPFDFLSRRGIVEDVYFDDYETDVKDNLWKFKQARRIILVKKDFSPASFLSPEFRPPTVPTVSVEPGADPHTELVFRWTASIAYFDRTIQKYFGKFNGGSPIEFNGSTLSYAVGTLVPGEQYHFQVAAYDGKYMSPYSPLKYAPTKSSAGLFAVQVATPAPGAVISGTAYAFTANVSADVETTRSITQVEYFAGNVSLGKSTNQDTDYRRTVNTELIANGTYQITAKATDSAGQVYASPPVSVTVTNNLPVKAAAPTGAITNDAQNFADWTLSPDAPLFSDYEYTKNNVLVEPVTAKPQPIPDQNIPGGHVKVRVKARPAQSLLASDWLVFGAYTQTPIAPTDGLVLFDENESLLLYDDESQTILIDG
jgi:hypothetical protein